MTKARLLDTFGRTLDLPVVASRPRCRPATSSPARPPRLRLRPRLPRPARWMFRLVDAGGGVEPAEARIDQVDPAGTVNPVAGFLLPDHLDESLELFDGAGHTRSGELFHEPIGGRVVWEIAPGRPGPPDAGPQFGLAGGQLPLGWLATGLVAADVKDRNGPAPSAESALSAALRAIDTTLWTVDTFAGLGSEHVAGLVGRPIAVVRAQLWLELQPEDLLDLSDPQRAAERTRGRAGAGRRGVPRPAGRADPHRRRPARVLRRRRLRAPPPRRPRGRRAGQAGRARGTPLGGAGADRAPLPRRRGHRDGPPRAAADAHPADAPGRACPSHLGRPSPQGARAGPGVGGAGLGAAVAVVADRAAAHRPRPGAAAQAVGVRRQAGVHPARPRPAAWRDDPILAATQTAPAARRGDERPGRLHPRACRRRAATA